MRTYRRRWTTYLTPTDSGSSASARPWCWSPLAVVGALIIGCASESTPSEGPRGRPGDDDDDGVSAGADAGDETGDADEDAGTRDAAVAKPPESDAGDPEDADDEPDDGETDEAQSDAAQSDAGSTADAGDGDAQGEDAGPRFPAAADLSKDGPYGSTTLSGVGPGGGYTAYVPEQLAPDGAKNPIVGWMSGGGTTHTLYPLLPRLATHGFLVMARDVTPGIGQEAMLGEQIIEGSGARIITPWYFGMRQFTSNTPLNTPEDFQGLRMRFPDTPQYLQNAEALGASPTSVAFEEVYISLQQGVVDGQENPIPTIESLNLPEVQSHLNLTGHMTGIHMIVVNEETFQSLTPEQQEVLRRVVTRSGLSQDAIWLRYFSLGGAAGPLEVEAHLSTHPAIKMVIVVSAPDERLGEVPAAFVEIAHGHELDEQGVIDFCRGAIAGFRVPRHVRFVTEWPMSAPKVQRPTLQKQLAAELEQERS